MARKPTAADKPEETKDDDHVYTPPEMPALPSKDGRKHRATYAKKRDANKNPMSGYNIRVEGPQAGAFSRRWLPVTRIDGSEAMEHALELLWSGKDDETGIPVALYTMWKKPKELDDAIPF
jgi:hypothetical protein